MPNKRECAGKLAALLVRVRIRTSEPIHTNSVALLSQLQRGTHTSPQASRHGTTTPSTTHRKMGIVIRTKGMEPVWKSESTPAARNPSLPEDWQRRWPPAGRTQMPREQNKTKQGIVVHNTTNKKAISSLTCERAVEHAKKTKHTHPRSDVVSFLKGIMQAL